MPYQAARTVCSVPCALFDTLGEITRIGAHRSPDMEIGDAAAAAAAVVASSPLRGQTVLISLWTAPSTHYDCSW